MTLKRPTNKPAAKPAPAKPNVYDFDEDLDMLPTKKDDPKKPQVNQVAKGQTGVKPSPMDDDEFADILKDNPPKQTPAKPAVSTANPSNQPAKPKDLLKPVNKVDDLDDFVDRS